MKVIWAITSNTFKEIIRDRILYLLFFFALLIIGMSLALGQLSFAEQTRISINFGLAAINLSAVILAVFVGASLVFKEIEKRTVLTLLARPISRSQFLTGKFFGLTFVILIIIFGLSLVLAGVLFGFGVDWTYDYTVALVGIIIEAEVLLSLTLLFGSFSKPTMTVMFALGFFMIGHWLDNMLFFAEKSENPIFKALAYFCGRVLPNLERFNWRTFATSDISIDAGIFTQSVVYGLFWVVFLVSLTCLVFRRKDFV